VHVHAQHANNQFLFDAGNTYGHLAMLKQTDAAEMLLTLTVLKEMTN
jgi:hypothetical protein